MKKRIVFIGNNSGGLYGFRHELMEEFVLRGYEVTALTPFDTKVEELNKLGITVIETPLKRRSINPAEDLKLLFLYWKLLRKIKPDLVITYTIKPNIYGGLVCRCLKISYASNITGLGTTFQKEGVLKRLAIFLYKVGLKKAKTVFFENAENKRIFINVGIVKEENSCLLNGAGVNLEHYQIADYPVEKGKTRFLFIGRIMQEKGIDELFLAMEKLHTNGVNCSLDMLGGYEEKYEEKVKKYEAEGWLHYYGYQKDVRPFIAKAYCFVLPSWHEGMANTNLECAAMGRPVITSNIHGCLEAVEDGVTGFLCEKQNADSLYEAMKKFTELSYEERKEMGLAGRRRMEEMFDKRNVVAKTLEALL